MGASIATNSVNSMINNAVNVLNNYAQVCSISATGAQNQISVNDCKVTNSHFVIGSQQIVSSSCITNANTQVAIASDISQTMQQAAQAITQQFSFPSIAAANNFINDSIKLGDTISNNYNTTCVSEANAASNTISCKGSTINNSIFEIESFQDITNNCVINAVQKANIYNKLVSDLSQTSVAKQQDTFAAILFAVAFLLAILAWFIIGVANNDIVKWVIVIVIFIAVVSSVIYTANARQNGFFPFTNA